MSLRPYFNGFHLHKMQALFASGDSDAVQTATAIINDMFSGDDPDTVQARRDCAKIISRAVNKGVPFRGLDAEHELHVWSAVALARTGQSFFRPDPFDTTWKISLMDDLLAQNGHQFDDPTHRLLTFIKDGRALFGKRIDSVWSYYAFLTSREVRDLAAGVRRARKSFPNLADETFFDGFLFALLGWLDKIARKKLDLWLYTS